MQYGVWLKFVVCYAKMIGDQSMKFLFEGYQLAFF